MRIIHEISRTQKNSTKSRCKALRLRQEIMALLLDSMRLTDVLPQLFTSLRDDIPVRAVAFLLPLPRGGLCVGYGKNSTIVSEVPITMMPELNSISAEPWGNDGMWMIQVQDADDALLSAFRKVHVKDEALTPPLLYILDNEASLLRNVLLFLDANETISLKKIQDIGQIWNQTREILHPVFSLHIKQYMLLSYQKKNITLLHRVKNTNMPELVGANHGLQQVVHRIQVLAPTDIPVLITGETGTGKDIVARCIHQHSPRSHKPFVAVNCGGIVPSLLESELFGHVRGAFTNAVSDHAGLIERAQGGTLFLDEVGELPPEGQTKLLRALQDRFIRRVGGALPMYMDVRIIAATNRNLSDMIRSSTFRRDLYYRLCGASIHIPPLRERTQSIPLLVQHYMDVISRQMDIVLPSVAPGQMEQLMNYSWPGNVRELINVISVGIACCENMPVRFSLPNRSEAALSTPPDDDVVSYETMARRYLSEVLRHSHGKIAGTTGAAALAGIPQNTFRSMLKRFHADDGTDREQS